MSASVFSLFSAHYVLIIALPRTRARDFCALLRRKTVSAESLFPGKAARHAGAVENVPPAELQLRVGTRTGWAGLARV